MNATVTFSRVELARLIGCIGSNFYTQYNHQHALHRLTENNNTRFNTKIEKGNFLTAADHEIKGTKKQVHGIVCIGGLVIILARRWLIRELDFSQPC